MSKCARKSYKYQSRLHHTSDSPLIQQQSILPCKARASTPSLQSSLRPTAMASASWAWLAWPALLKGLTFAETCDLEFSIINVAIRPSLLAGLSHDVLIGSLRATLGLPRTLDSSAKHVLQLTMQSPERKSSSGADSARSRQQVRTITPTDRKQVHVDRASKLRASLGKDEQMRPEALEPSMRRKGFHIRQRSIQNLKGMSQLGIRSTHRR